MTNTAATTKVMQFCPACFADEESGSWNHLVLAGYCTNCGNGSTVQLPEWAIKSVRQSASWVGRRYYPGEEDREIQAERAALLALVTEFPGRSAERDPDRPGHWRVKQETPATDARPYRSYSTTMVEATTAEEAMRKCCLRYISADHLAGKTS